MKKNLKDYTLKELENLMISMSEPKFRANQIFKWLYDGAESFEDMKNIPKSLIEKLEGE